jgi:hypothetical protein
MRKHLILLMGLISIAAHATTFVPLPIKQQIQEAQGIVEGEVVAVNSQELQDGSIATRIFLRADKWVGLSPESDHIEVYFPGGHIGDKVHKIEGAPEFQIGEKVVLMTQNIENQIWIQNLSLGKFSIKKFGLNDIVVNSVFPNHPQAGQMSLKAFHELVQSIKKEEVQVRFKDKYERNHEKYHAVKSLHNNNSRKIASVEDETEKNNFNTYWLVFILGFIGAIFSFVKIRKNH